MPLQIPNNAIPIRFPPGTRTLADITTNKVMNPHFWPEDIARPNPEFQFPHITLITKGFRIAPKRAFHPFRYGNIFLMPTIAWLVSINFISLDDLTEADCGKLDEYHKTLEGQFVWSFDDDDLESFKPTMELKNAWLQKYKRRDAFLHRKKVHDLVRRKDIFVTEEIRQLIERRQKEEKQSLQKNIPPPYHYERDLQGGRLRRVYPPVLEKGRDPWTPCIQLTEAEKLCKSLNFPPGHMPSQEEIEEAGGHMEWRALLLEQFNLEPHPTDSVMPARRFWPIHTAARKRVLSVFPIPQILPPSKYVLQDAPKPVVCWNRLVKAPSGPPGLSIANEEKRDTTQSIKEVAAQVSAPDTGAGNVTSTHEPLSAGSTVSSQSVSPSEDVVMAEIPASSSPEPLERRLSDADVTMAAEAQPSPILREHNAQAAAPPVSDSASAKKRKRDDGNSEQDLPPAKRTINSKPSATTSSNKASSLSSQIKPMGTNQVPSPLGRPLHLLKDSPFPSPDDFTISRPIAREDIFRLWSQLSEFFSPQSLRARFKDLEADALFCKLTTSENLRGIEAHRANPNRQEGSYETWKRRLMVEWRLVPSPLRSSVTVVRDKATGKKKIKSSRAFNHKWSVRKFQKKRKEKRIGQSGMVVAEQPEEEENLGVLLPKGMPRKPEVILGWRLKGPRVVFGRILPGGGLSGREASGIWTGPVVPAEYVITSHAAGWTGQPLVG